MKLTYSILTAVLTLGPAALAGNSAGGDVTGSAQLANVGAKGGYVYYPAISFDSAGNLITTYDQSSASTYESIQVASLKPTGSSGAVTGWTMSPSSTLDASTGYYDSTGTIPCDFGANGFFTGSNSPLGVV